MDDDFLLEDDEMLEDIDIPIICNNVLENFPFIEDDVDALTDYELFCKGFGYLDEKKADKKDIPDVSDFITKDVDNLTNYYDKDETDSLLENKVNTSELTNYYDKDSVDNLLENKANISDIPDVSDFITKDVNDLTYYTKTSDLSNVATTGDYDDLLNKPTIPVVPTDISSFNNDSGYITNSVNDLTNYTLTSTLTSLLAGKENIIEYGSNTNGSYIKFDNGNMICYQTQELGRLDYSTSFGAIYWTNQVHSWDYPVAFKTGTTPVVIPSVYTQSIGNANLQTVPTETTATCFIYCFSSNTARTTVLQWIAIGKWK